MSLATFILRRLFLLIFMLLAVTILTFFLSRVIPGDPAQMMAGMRASQTQVENMRERLGLDKPLGEQFQIYLGDLLSGDLGVSIMNKRPVVDNLQQFFPATLELAVTAFIMAACVGVPLGIAAAVYRNTWVDQLSRIVALAGIAFPSFWLGIVLILVFFFFLGWLPGSRRADMSMMSGVTPITNLLLIDSLLVGNLALFQDALAHLILPVVTLAFGPMARFMRFTRAVMLDEIGKQYVLTAQSKGLRQRNLIRRHVLRNALIPIVTVMGLALGSLLSGSVLVETIFNWPGIGQYAFNAVYNLDYPSIVGVTLLTTLLVLLINLLVDVLYAYLDPRIRYS